MRSIIFLAVIVTVSAVSLSGQVPAPPAELAVTIATPIYLNDGRVIGGSGTWKVRPGQTITAYPNGGDDFCRAGSKDDNGWQVALTRNQADGLSVRWQRVSLAGAQAGQQLQQASQAPSGSARELFQLMTSRHVLQADLNGRASGSAELDLKSGGRAMLDFIGFTRVISSNMAAEVAAVSRVAPCKATGMGLEIRLDRAESRVLETELWLIHTRSDGSSETQRQAVRSVPGYAAEYWFDDVHAPLTIIGHSTDTREYAFRISGKVQPQDLSDSKIYFGLEIGRSASPVVNGIPAQNAVHGSAHYDAAANPDEVLSFTIPPWTDATASLKSDALSL